jgi:hypothetical protein
MASRRFEQLSSLTVEKNVVKLYATIVTSTSGAVASVDCMGASIAKVSAEAGRYRVTLADAYQRLLACNAIVSGAADAAYTTANGVQAIVRNVAVSAATPVLDIQFVRTDTGADAEVIDGATIYAEITLSNSSS